MERSGGRVPAPPKGWRRITWLGPGFLWMVSAAGSGELLFTPRIGSVYGYSLLWAMIAAIALKWVINREIGRYAVCTGSSLLEGFTALERGGKWAVWAVVAPQVVVAVSALAGMAGSAATALILVLPGDVRLWMAASLLSSATLVSIGRYRAIERTAVVIGAALGVAATIAAVLVSPSVNDMLAGLRPTLPEQVDYAEILPWLGFMLSGAAGMVWYSYWVPAKGYGMARTQDGGREPFVNARSMSADDTRRLRGWLAQMTIDNTVAVLGTFVIAAAFLVLGAEVLRPEGLVPEERRVASTLGRLLGDIWGPTAYWLMIAGVFVGFWDTVLADQDGHARVFTEGSAMLVPPVRRFSDSARRRVIVALLLTLCPLVVYLAIGEPVRLLKIAGAIEAAHIPFVALLTLALNRCLPSALRPSAATIIATVVAAAFFAAFAGYYVWSLM